MVVHATPAHFSIIGDRVPRTGDAEVRQGKWQMGGRFITRVLAHLGRFSPDGEGDLDGGGGDLLGVELVVGRTTQCLSRVSPLPVSR